MSTVIQIQNVPDHIHREVKARAAREGLTLSDFVLQALRRELRRRPRAPGLAARIRQLEPVADAPPGEVLIRAQRDAR